MPGYAYTAFVDGTFGSANGMVQNPNAPFLTIMMAITAILNSANPPSEQQQWDIQVHPGFYFESPVLPAGINIIGSGTSTLIFGTLTVQGSSIVRDVVIFNNNAPSVVVTRPINVGDSAFLNVVIVNSWTGTFTTRATAVRVNVGDVTFESGAIFATFSGSGPEASAVSSAGGLALFNVLTNFEASSNFNKAYVFSVEGDKSAITECPINANFTGGKTAAIFRASNITASFKENRITVTSKRTEEVAMVSTGQKTDLLLTNNFFDISDVPAASALLAKSDVVATAANLPIVRFLSNEFVQSVIPPTKGNFGQLSFDLFDGEGSFKFSGGLYAPIKSVCGSYTVKTDDYTLLVDCRVASQIILPTGRFGQVIYIKNISQKPVSLGGCNDGSVSLDANRSVNLQSDGAKWYIIANY